MKSFFVLFVLFLGVSNPIFSQESYTKHTVEKGENVFQIAQKYKVSVDDLYKLNPESQQGIKENTIILIPNANVKRDINPQKTHTVQPKETLFSLANLYNVSVDALQNANTEILKDGLKIGQILIIPKTSVSKNNTVVENTNSKSTHQVVAKETLFSIARLYNVSVQDLDNLNSEALKGGMQIGQTILIPNKKKTLDGKARVINSETIFHTVLPKETKYSITKQYGITIEQLETQNPEIINGLIEGSKLAINVKQIKPTSENEELMIALAEKQVALEKTKAKTTEVQDLEDKLAVQKEMNQKVLKVNALKVNLKEIDEKKGGSAEKLKLVLEANKNVQDILISKLDSLVITMGDDLVQLKQTEITDVEESKKLEKQSYESIGKTDEMLFQLKKDLADNRKIYSGIMNKVQRITVQENQEYKKKVRENQSAANLKKPEDLEALEAINKLQSEQEKNDKINQKLLTKLDSLGTERKVEFKRRIQKATFYSEEARLYDDKLALQKLKRYKKEAITTQKGANDLDKTPNNSDSENTKTISEELRTVKIEVLKNLKDVENGYYLVLDIFKEADLRDQFVMKLIDSGEVNTSFFYSVNIFSYYVYTNTFKTIEETLKAYKQKENTLYHDKMYIVKIEN